MASTRRAFFLTASTGLGLVAGPTLAGRLSAEPGETRDCSELEADVQEVFAKLPERKSFKIWAPATEKGSEFLTGLHGEEGLFSASTNKAFILCERLRQVDSPAVGEELVTHELTLDERVWSLGSSVFNPPHLSGVINERTVMEAMITHSDNTATDMVLKQAGPDNVRQFIQSIGLKNTMIPDSTRALFGYVVGAPDYKRLTWDEMVSLAGAPLVHPLLNDVETLASSADDLVFFFGRALQGKFFANRQTLREFRRILSLGDITYLVPFPLGMSVFGKAGYFDAPGYHGRCIAGGMYFPERWVYFAMILNWEAPAAQDPTTVEAYFGAVRSAIELVYDGLRD